MKEISSFSWKVSLSIAFFFLICFTSLASFILPAFIEDPQTSQLGAEFLRIACLAVSFTAINALIIYTLQAMGKGVESAILTVCRQGVIKYSNFIYYESFCRIIWNDLGTTCH